MNAVPKCAQAHPCAPSANLLWKIGKINREPGRGECPRRWFNYKVGMSLWEAKIGYNLDHLDLLFYRDRGILDLVPCTDKEVQAAWKKWQEM